MKITLLTVFLLYGVPLRGLAQPSLLNPLQIDFDIARFYGDETQVYVELYYSIRERNFTFQESHGKFVAGINMEADITQGSDLVTRRSWSVPYMIDDTSLLTPNKTIVAKENFLLTSGEYTVKIVSRDVFDTTRVHQYTIPLTIKLFQSELPLLSDLELCSSIQSSTNSEGMFFKNTLEVIPNPSKLYGAGVPFVYYYLEAYNLLKHQEQQRDVLIRTNVIDGEGNIVHQEQSRKPRVYDSSVEIGKINTSQMKTGSYLLMVSLMDSTEKIYATSSKKFFVYKSLPPEKDSNSTQTLSILPEYLLMDETQLDKEFSQARYIATDAERRQYKLLTEVNAKRKFLSDFWNRRDSDPATVENEYRQEYKKRVELVVQEIPAGTRPAWETDRGRVLLMYGRADEIERFPSTAESNPYEIWRYTTLQGGVIFVFVDRGGFGDYVLVHSTHRDELHDENWFQEYAQKMR